MRIITRLKASAVITLVAMLALTPLLLWQGRKFEDAKSDYLLAESILNNLFERAALRDQYLLYREDHVRAQWDQSKASAEALVLQAQTQFTHPTERLAVEELHVAIEDSATLFHRVVANTKALKAANEKSAVYDELDKRLHSQLLLKASAVRQAANVLHRAAEKRMQQTNQRVALLLGVFAATLALAGMAISLQISRLIRRRIVPLHEGTRIVADGNLEHHIQFNGTDEFSELARAINAMTDSLKAYASDMEVEVMQRDQAELALRESEAHLRAILAASPVPTGLHDAEQNITYLNAAFIACFGYTLQDIPTLSHWWLKAYPDPQYRALAQVRWTQALEKTRQDHAPFETMEVDIRCKDNSVRTVLAGAVLMQDSSLDMRNETHLVTLYDITARKQAERKLAELNRDFVAFLDNTSDFVYFKDAHSRLRFCSQTLADITGHAHWRDMTGKHDLEVFPPDTARIYQEEEMPIFQHGKPLLGKIDPYYDASGQPGWVNTNKWPVLDAQGKVVGLFGISRDITLFKRAQQALQESESRFRQMFERNDAVMLLVQPDGGLIVDANAAAARFYGYPLEQLKAMHISQINVLAPEEIANELQFAKQHERNFFTFPHRLANGDIRTVEVRSSTIELGNQVVLFSIITDISERHKAEETQRLAASVFSHAREGIMITTSDGSIVNVNDAFTRITGYTLEEVRGRNPHVLSSGRQSKEFYATLWYDLAAKGYWYGEVWNRRKCGELYAEMQTISAVKDEHGRTQHYVSLFSDITDRKEMEDRVRQMAFYDPLTQLPNRRLLTDRLNQTMATNARSGRFGAMMFLDLDNFKPLNDSHGHECGDLLLIECAHRLKNCVRETDTVARFGGDEFVVMLGELEASKTESSAQAGQIAEKIRLALAKPYRLTLDGGNGASTTVEHHCTASIGVALFFARTNRKDEILKWADSAMYRAKDAGRNTVRFYTP